MVLFGITDVKAAGNELLVDVLFKFLKGFVEIFVEGFEIN
ncbi:MAG: hypothetical protein KatS3mg087_0940 [Patescibacteria group bacterium]|nr:MAG: hypothetical protein KatS3mg087_0940 [Patescibacteria group bacterium]